MSLPAKQLIESEYEVKLGLFEGPLDLLLYLVQKNELDPRQIQISVITDQYLAYMDTIKEMNLANAGEFLVMAARLMRLKARELLPADQKDELEDMEYELDRQKLIQQMLEYQKFKEAARVLRNHESRHFGAYGRGRPEAADEKSEAELEEEAGVFDLLSAFRNVVLQKPKLPVHEVEIDDVTIEDRMQEVEIALNERGRSQFEDLFANDSRTISLVVTFMAILELAKLDRIVFRQSHALGPIWVYRKQKAADYELELKLDESHLDPLPEFKEGLVEIVQAQIKQRAVKNALEEALRDLENGIMPGEGKAAAAETAVAETGDAETAGAEAAGAETAVADAAPPVTAGLDEPGTGAGPDTAAGSLDEGSPGAGTAFGGPVADEPMGAGTLESGTDVGEGMRSAAEGRESPEAGAGEGAGTEGASQVDTIADSALRELMQRMREASAGEINSEIPDDED
jgi:chromatin segregation and condensation protein Rec8/ScpA/Scc1 (kleisin family)